MIQALLNKPFAFKINSDSIEIGIFWILMAIIIIL